MNESIKNLIVAGESYRMEFKRLLDKSFIEEFCAKSVTRNPLIASLLHRIDFIEKVGTGIGRIKQEVEKHGGCTAEINYDTFYTITFRAKAPAHKETVTTEVKQKAPVKAPVATPKTTPKTTPITADDRGRGNCERTINVGVNVKKCTSAKMRECASARVLTLEPPRAQGSPRKNLMKKRIIKKAQLSPIHSQLMAEVSV